jgi:nitrate reductase alpha subunit
MDTAKLLKASEIFPNYRVKTLTRTKVVEKEADLPKPYAVNEGHGVVLKDRREAWGDFVLWDTKTNKPVAVSRDDVGKYARSQGLDPALEGEFTVQINGKAVKVRPVFDNIKSYLEQTWTPEQTSKVTWAPISAVQSVARTAAAHKEKTLFAVGMGPNQMFNADLKDRAIFLLATLTRNVGFVGGNVGSYAGNYRAAYFNGVPQYFAEDPFHPTDSTLGCILHIITPMRINHCACMASSLMAIRTLPRRPSPCGSRPPTLCLEMPKAITRS